jgi:cation diffusion facilitator CzcD-associated flavoprotein CzcO
MKVYDTIVIGGGQAGLSVAYFLRRKKLDFLVLDNQSKAGGSWLHTWDGLKLFSPVEYSSLSGWPMPRGANEYPTKNEFISYMEKYQERYHFPTKRNTEVYAVTKKDNIFKIDTNSGVFYSNTLVSATGTANSPFIPKYPSLELFKGISIHSVQYKNANEFANKNVLVVGGGNSGAQVLAEVSKLANTQWVTLDEPHFLPDDVDGRYLFKEANQSYLGKSTKPSKSLSNIVMVESVKEARTRKVLHAKRPFQSFYENGIIWEDGTREAFDAVIWCTGFQANLKHLSRLGIVEDSKIKTQHTRVIKEPNLWLVGYGNWTGFASATIYGVGKTARKTVEEITIELNSLKNNIINKDLAQK